MKSFCLWTRDLRCILQHHFLKVSKFPEGITCPGTISILIYQLECSRIMLKVNLKPKCAWGIDYGYTLSREVFSPLKALVEVGEFISLPGTYCLSSVPFHGGCNLLSIAIQWNNHSSHALPHCLSSGCHISMKCLIDWRDNHFQEIPGF